MIHDCYLSPTCKQGSLHTSLQSYGIAVGSLPQPLLGATSFHQSHSKVVLLSAMELIMIYAS